jgi:hypothetical protein
VIRSTSIAARTRTRSSCRTKDGWHRSKAPAWLNSDPLTPEGQHLSRLRDWVAELVDLRTRPVVDEWEG